jgi:hypothetical protein
MQIRFGTVVSLAAISFSAVLTTGCLSTAHKIPQGDLQVMAQTPPEQRSQNVRVIQAFHGDEPPAAQPVNSNTTIIVVGTGHHHHHDEHHGGGGGGSAGGTSGGGGSGGSGGGDAADAADDGKAWIIIAVAAGVALAVTEGSRFDGWVDLHPMHPVHLYGAGGQYRMVPMAQLTPELAAWAHKAYVRPSEGPWQNAERAPLNRKGWTYSVMLGYGQIPSGQEEAAGISTDSAEPGFLGHIQFGHFVTKETGVLLDFGLGWRTNEFDNAIFEARNAIEIQHFPVDAGWLHLGGYGQVGIALRAEDDSHDTVSNRAFVGGAGVLAQIELTTRLAITGRAGYTRIFGEDTAEASLGLSIY